MDDAFHHFPAFSDRYARANSADPDQMASRRESDHGLCCLLWSASFEGVYHNDPKFSDRLVCANGADPDQTAPLQTAPRGAV